MPHSKATAQQNAGSDEVFQGRINIADKVEWTMQQMPAANPHSMVSFKNLLMLTQLRNIF